jgi:hypothetical protein
MSRYLPPAKRVAKDEPIVLSEANFPVLSSSPSPVRSPMNFKDCFKPLVKSDETVKNYPGGIDQETRTKMINDGWAFLSLGATKERGFCERWNERITSYVKAIVETTPSTDLTPNENCDKPYDYNSSDEESLSEYLYAYSDSSSDNE